jgi:uncharacterized membrane protein
VIFLIVLALGTLAAITAQLLRGRVSLRDAARLGMAVAMVVAGIAHWVRPLPFLQHLPPWSPAPDLVIFGTGVVEVVLGIALLAPQPWRRRTGLALGAYLVAVFPANLYVAVANIDVDGQPGGAYPWLRLPLQALFIAWAVWSTRSTGPQRPITPARPVPARSA